MFQIVEWKDGCLPGDERECHVPPISLISAAAYRASVGADFFIPDEHCHLCTSSGTSLTNFDASHTSEELFGAANVYSPCT
jgi:hypothetical protein